jgi:transcriptional regulator with XRE-family HTH domain
MTADELKQIRSKLGYSQEEMARCVGISLSYYQKMENQAKPIPEARAKEIDELLK